MTKDVMRDHVRTFLSTYLPVPENPDDRITAHDLMYDFHGEYQNIRFSGHETLACLRAYIALLDPLKAYIQHDEQHLDSERKSIYRQRAHSLYHVSWLRATELLIAYIDRTRLDDGLDALIDYIKDRHPREQVQDVIQLVDPQNKVRGMDAVKRMVRVMAILDDLAARY